MNTTVTSVNDAERRATIARVLLDRACDELAELGRMLDKEELDRSALQLRVFDVGYLLYIAGEELELDGYPAAPQSQS